MSFTLFSLEHILIILICLGAVYGVGSCGVAAARAGRTGESKKHILQTDGIVPNLIRWGLIAGLVINEVFSFWILQQEPTTTLLSYLPLHISQIAPYVMIVALLAPRHPIAVFAVWLAGWSSILALILPEVQQSFPHPRFLEFFAGYILLLSSITYLVRIEQIRLSWQSMWISYAIILVYGVGIFLFNLVFETNYLFLREKPSRGQMWFLPPEPWHVPVLGVLLAPMLAIQRVLIRFFAPSSVSGNQ